MYKSPEWEAEVKGDCISCTWISGSEAFTNNLSFLCRLFLLCCHSANCTYMWWQITFLLFQVSSGADKSITRGAGSSVVLPKHSAACSESHLLPPTRLSKPAGFKGSTNISAQHDHSVVPLEKMSAFMPIFTLQQTCRSEQNSHMAKNFWQHGLAETHLIILIQLWGQFYDSHKFYCSMTFNDIWALKFHLQENCHGKESEWKGMSDYSEPQVCMHSAKKISSC